MIYFDNAATTYPKPRSVAQAMLSCMQNAGGNAGRGSHAMSLEAGRVIFDCREAVGRMFGASPEQVVFTMNATHALNIAIKGLARGGGHILISDLEHNAVRRCVASLRQEGVGYGIFATHGGDGEKIEKEILRQLRPKTQMIVCTHASNLCSIRLPIEIIGRICRQRGIKLVVDASQSAGVCRIDIDQIGADAICAPGHKGLYGPQGCGFAVFAKKYLGDGGRMLKTRIEGGSGVESIPEQMPDFLPERLEAGTLAAPCIAGLCAGIREVEKVGVENIARHEATLFERMREQLREIPSVHLYAPDHAGSVLSFTIKDISCDRVSEFLSEGGVCHRSGFHCAPLAHKTLGTARDGAIRCSFSMYNTADEVDRVCAMLRDLR